MVRRVILIVADGLRADAVTPSVMPALYSLGWDYARALNATTVRPTVTVAALASLATGVGPETHGLVNPGLGFLRGLSRLKPLARELRHAGITATVVGSELDASRRRITRALAAAAGIQSIELHGGDALETAARARARLSQLGRCFLMVYLKDCDYAGHEHGWMSAEYLAAAKVVDTAIGGLAVVTERDLVVVTADHGGGGIVRTDHDGAHQLNASIPLVAAGPEVVRHRVLHAPVSLLDVPATILWAFGLDVPPSYEGRILKEAFIVDKSALAATT
jgi:hypothetical protein